MTRALVRPLLIAVLLLTAAGEARGQAHPLDPLTREEHFAVLEILRAERRIDDDTRFSRIALRAPEKSQVWAWTSGTRLPRHAEVVATQGAEVVEGLVDLTARRVTAWSARPGVQPMWLEGEFGGPLVGKVLADPRVRAALARRGVDDQHFLSCLLVPPGNFGEAKYAGRRVGVLSCRMRTAARNNWARRIEGLIVVVDLRSEEILEVADDEMAPVPPGSADFDTAAVGPLRPLPGTLEVSQPGAAGFTLDGHVVTWDRWRFHVASDARVGTVISTAVWRDGTRERPVLYEGHLSEIFVPYMDPRRDWYVRTFIDAGEFSAGGLADSLVPGVDCPAYATFLDALATEDRGWPREKARAVCLFERDAGDMLWRHGSEGRPQRELVVRMAAMIGNYDYVVDWRFQMDGQIRVSLGATGIVEAKMTAVPNARQAGTNGTNGEPAADAYGRFVEDHVVAVNHDHYFNFRIDLDVDGPTNRFVRDTLVAQRLPDDHPRRSLWVAEPSAPAREHDARAKMDMHRPALWRVTGDARNHVGYPTSYQLLPSHAIHTLLAPDDYARRRAGFIDYDLWVTPYSAAERYAAGDYPTLSTAGQGLPAWTEGNRSIADTDIVLWYTFGMHHMVRAEEWPVMPVLWHDFTLRPFDFHDRNPALDVGPRR